MVTRGDEVFCDTNVLVAAVDVARAMHRQALHVLNHLPQAGVLLCVSGQVLRELLAVSTRPVAANGLGLSVADALDNVRSVSARVRVLEETRGVALRLLTVVSESGSSGKRVHDANIVATMQEHGVRKLITDNLDDFERYEQIEVVDLALVDSRVP
jgi:predicted nucleic acid-binding protein